MKLKQLTSLWGQLIHHAIFFYLNGVGLKDLKYGHAEKGINLLHKY